MRAPLISPNPDHVLWLVELCVPTKGNLRSPNNPNNSNRISPYNNLNQPGYTFRGKNLSNSQLVESFSFSLQVPKDLGSPYPQPVLMLIFLGSGNIGKTKNKWSNSPCFLKPYVWIFNCGPPYPHQHHFPLHFCRVNHRWLCDLKSQNASEKEVPQNLNVFHSSLVPLNWPSIRNNPSFPRCLNLFPGHWPCP